jgi:hypothetical protein
MQTGDKDIDVPSDQSVLADDSACATEADRGFFGRVSSASKLAGDYLSLAGAGVAKTALDVKDVATTHALKASAMVSDAYQSATDLISDKGAIKEKAVDSGKSAVVDAGIAMASGLAVMGLKRVATAKGLSLLKPLSKGNMAAHLVDASVTLGQHGYKLYKGEATKSEVAHACAEKGSGMLATVGGAGLGAMAATALALPTGGASLVIGGASMLGGIAGPKAYQAGRKMVEDLIDKHASKKPSTLVERASLGEGAEDADKK